MFEVHISKHSPFRLKITVGCPRCCSVLCVVCACGVWCVCLVVLVVVVVLCVVWVLCGCCVVVWCVFLCLFLFFLSVLFFLFLALSLFATAANFEAFECDLAHGKCTAVGSLPPPLPSLLFCLPLPQKKGGNFLLQEYFWRGNFFHYSLKLIQKNRRAGEITVITVLY